ncbi:hypothetical protein ABZT49_08950 [Methylobacterium sp. EM32]|uniref:hypothetical protein n=1 Tax=Methylobacterium sp. EM32 TaxID=3163481 RepID=UPI0033B4F85E
MTTVTILYRNTGGAIENLGIKDAVSGKMHNIGYLEANGGDRLDRINVRDAAVLVAEIEIYYDDVQKFPAQKIKHGGNVDVYTGRVSDP